MNARECEPLDSFLGMLSRWTVDSNMGVGDIHRTVMRGWMVGTVWPLQYCMSALRMFRENYYCRTNCRVD